MPVPDQADASIIVTTRPEFSINGSLRIDVSEALVSMDVSESWISGKSAEIELMNWGTTGVGSRPGFPFFVDPIRFGDQVEIKVGAAVLIEGMVTALEGRYEKGSPPLLSITVSQEVARMDNAGKERSFQEMSLSEVVSLICGEYGFSAEVPGQELDLVFSNLVQSGESDLEFLGQLFEETDLFFIFKDNILEVQHRYGGSSETFSLNPNGKLYSYSLRADVLGAPTQLEGRLYDGSSGEVSIASAGLGDLPSSSNASANGPTVSESVWGTVKQSLSDPRMGLDGLSVAVESRYKQFARAFVIGDGECVFDAALTLGSTINFSGLGKPFNGRAVVSAVSHRFDQNFGLRTYFETERMQIGSDVVSLKKPVKAKKSRKSKKPLSKTKRSSPPPARTTAVRRLSRRRGTRNLK